MAGSSGESIKRYSFRKYMYHENKMQNESHIRIKNKITNLMNDEIAKMFNNCDKKVNKIKQKFFFKP